jgi:hypothetical protein
LGLDVLVRLRRRKRRVVSEVAKGAKEGRKTEERESGGRVGRERVGSLI